MRKMEPDMDPSIEASLTDHQHRILNHIRACDASGQRITEYCAEHGIKVRAMYDGRKSMVNKGILPRTHPRRFQRVSVARPSVTAAPPTDWRIQLPNGTSVAFSGDVDSKALKQVLNTVAELS